MVARLLALAVAVTWLASSICNAHDDVLLMSPERIAEKFTFYPSIPFDSAHATKGRYTRFIQYVREEMVSGDKVHGIPRLHNPANLPEYDRFLLVVLYNSDGARIFLALDKATANVVGYRTLFDAYFFPDTNGLDTSSLFPGFTRHLLPFNSSYSAMEKIAGSRSKLALGMGDLDKAIQYLHDNTTSHLASSLLVAIQMVSEAVRYRYVENMVVKHIIDNVKNSFFPTATMITFEDNWEQLSSRIQESVGGVIYPPFVLPNASYPITSITPLLGRNIAVILYICDSCSNIPEPTVHIVGRNGLCVDVTFDTFVEWNWVLLWPCKSKGDDNQLFTLMKDGTIRSKGMCLTAALPDNNKIYLHNCTTLSESYGIKWEIEENGNIINQESKLALTTYDEHLLPKILVEQKSYSSSQGWSLTNNTEPAVTSIFTYNGMCMQASGWIYKTVKLANCSDQGWAIYPDGTVRPSTSTSTCLASQSSPDGNKTVLLQSCNGGDAERWLFNHDRSLSDGTNNYLLQVNKDQEIVLVKRSANSPTSEQIFDINFL